MVLTHQPPHILTRCTCYDMQRNKVVLPWLSLRCRWMQDRFALL
jgi:hypothetical protein